MAKYFSSRVTGNCILSAFFIFFRNIFLFCSGEGAKKSDASVVKIFFKKNACKVTLLRVCFSSKCHMHFNYKLVTDISRDKANLRCLLRKFLQLSCSKSVNSNDVFLHHFFRLNIMRKKSS